MAEQNLQGSQDPAQGGPNQTPPAIDYAKIQQMLEGTLAAKEDTALKAYFKQQGMSEEEMKQAIAAFKQQRAASQPDIGELQGQVTEAQNQLAKAQEEVKRAKLESAAAMEAVTMGIAAGTIPYMLKLADFGKAMEKDGSINAEELKAALNKVLEDVPAFKPQTAGSTGFVKIGAEKEQKGKQEESVTLKGAVSEALKKR